MNILRSKKLTKNYGKKRALNNVSFEINKGEVVGLLGPNGSGKTTLIKIITGLIEDYEGEIKIMGENPSYKTKSHVSYLPDKPFFDESYSIKRICEIFSDFYEDFSIEKFEELIEKMKLSKNEKISNLSKGMKEKLNLSLILSRNAEIYVIDEPIAGVDIVAREFIIDSIIDNINPNSTMIITTHLVKEIERIFDKAIFFKEGEIIEEGNVEDLRKKYKTNIEEIYKNIYGGYDA
ncbi:MAG: ABC transporter ATP-binding protein [Peptoniphilaceae bacterium]|nr:ABC transporter ATP-binding protein [Peptoniphilaceae bacterium]MDD7383890.1 ABC transporter ATP-binding protein [Peptoniphilaceae bacterium]MDY3738031.1 ABC transporter ATP-binding protein [Peptoniphilaceae bacterium]